MFQLICNILRDCWCRRKEMGETQATGLMLLWAACIWYHFLSEKPLQARERYLLRSRAWRWKYLPGGLHCVCLPFISRGDMHAINSEQMAENSAITIYEDYLKHFYISESLLLFSGFLWFPSWQFLITNLLELEDEPLYKIVMVCIHQWQKLKYFLKNNKTSEYCPSNFLYLHGPRALWLHEILSGKKVGCHALLRGFEINSPIRQGPSEPLMLCTLNMSPI